MQALGPRSEDVVLLHDLHHTAAHIADPASDILECQHRARQNQVAQKHRVRFDARGIEDAARWKPAQIHCEDVDQQQAHKEARRRYHDEGEAAGDVIAQGVRLGRGEDAQRQGDNQPHNHRGSRKQSRNPEALGDHRHNSAVRAVRIAQIPHQKGFQPGEILDNRRLIQAKLLTAAFQFLRRDARIRKKRVERASWSHRHDEVGEQGDAKKGWDSYEDSLCDILSFQAAFPFLRDNLRHAPLPEKSCAGLLHKGTRTHTHNKEAVSSSFFQNRIQTTKKIPVVNENTLEVLTAYFQKMNK